MMNASYQLDDSAPDDDDQPRGVLVRADEMRDRIARLEKQIDELTQSIEGCRKTMLASKGLVGAGAILLLAIVIGAIRLDPLALMAAIAALLGGLVLFGSNSSTSKQKNAALRAAESERADLIGKIDLTLVDERDGNIWSPAN